MKTPGIMWIAMGGLVFLMVTGCSSKNVKSTNETELSSSDGAPGKGGGNALRGAPLTGFGKKPADESIAGTAPRMLSKADQQGMDSREARKTREDSRKQLLDIYFAFDRWGLSEEGKKNLSESAAFLREHPKAKLFIEGHCDERGSVEYNLALAKSGRRKRASICQILGSTMPLR